MIAVFTRSGGRARRRRRQKVASRDAWQPTVALMRCAVTALLLTAAAVFWRRPDLLVVATPMALITAWALLTRPTEPVQLSAHLGTHTLREGESTRWRGTVSGDDHIDFVTALLADAPWFQRQPEGGVVTVRTHDGTAQIDIGVRSTRWGTRPVQPVTVVAVTAWASFRWTTEANAYRLITLPVPAIFDSSAWARPTDGLIGLHRSSRAGEGNEFATVRPFRVGDRMRRINWPRSARSGELLVNATLADLDTHVALVVDASRDIGASDGVDGRASSLDATVRAAGAIAEHFAPRGERVSLHTFGSPRPRTVPPATGQAQLRRILDELARVEPPSLSQPGSRNPARDARGLTGNRLTVMVSALVVPNALHYAVSLGRHGMSVIVVDTLPEAITTDDDAFGALAWRIRLLERRRELRLVQTAGIPVVRWLGPGSLDQVIRDISRRAAAPRVVVR